MPSAADRSGFLARRAAGRRLASLLVAKQNDPQGKPGVFLLPRDPECPGVFF